MKRAVIILISVLLVMAAGIGLKLFIIGEPVDGDTLAIEVQSHDHQVDIYINSPDSALGISNIDYRYEGTVLHLTVWKVLASSLHNSGSTCLYYEITDETEIWLGGRQIWKAE